MIACRHEHKHKTPEQLLTTARQICDKQGRRFTKLREHVFTLIANSKGPIKAYDLLDQLCPEFGSSKPPTVYRALDFLSRLELVHRVEALNAYIACDHSVDNDQKRGGHIAEFFICEICETLEERSANDHIDCVPDGFDICRSVIEHYGICKNCVA